MVSSLAQILEFWPDDVIDSNDGIDLSLRTKKDREGLDWTRESYEWLAYEQEDGNILAN